MNKREGPTHLLQSPRIRICQVPAVLATMQTLLLLLFSIACVQGQSKLVQWFTMAKARTVETQSPSYYHEWLVFKKAHGKVYGDINTEQRRYEIFKDNLQFIEENNKLYRLGKKTFYLGINEYTDMTHEEFKRYMHLDKLMQHNSEEASAFIPPFLVQVPDQVDWRTKGFVTPVKNQRHCGSCWAFSTTGSMEGLHFKKTGKLVSLSEQQLVDCSSSYNETGCDGGYVTYAFMYIKEKGLESETSYKYKAKQYPCSYDKSAVVAKCSGYKGVKKYNESNLKVAVATQGPVSVSIDAFHISFRFYKGGVYNEPNCSTKDLDHGVLAVGYGTNKTTGDDYWIVKNSWGTTWGMDGYIMMSRNKKNQCGIATDASFPI